MEGCACLPLLEERAAVSGAFGETGCMTEDCPNPVRPGPLQEGDECALTEAFAGRPLYCEDCMNALPARGDTEDDD